MIKFLIYSESKGYYCGFFGARHGFCKEILEIKHDFVSESGAKSYLEIAPLLAEFPDDCSIKPFESKEAI